MKKSFATIFSLFTFILVFFCQEVRANPTCTMLFSSADSELLLQSEFSAISDESKLIEKIQKLVSNGAYDLLSAFFSRPESAGFPKALDFYIYVAPREAIRGLFAALTLPHWAQNEFVITSAVHKFVNLQDQENLEVLYAYIRNIPSTLKMRKAMDLIFEQARKNKKPSDLKQFFKILVPWLPTDAAKYYVEEIFKTQGASDFLITAFDNPNLMQETELLKAIVQSAPDKVLFSIRDSQALNNSTIRKIELEALYLRLYQGPKAKFYDYLSSIELEIYNLRAKSAPIKRSEAVAAAQRIEKYYSNAWEDTNRIYDKRPKVEVEEMNRTLEGVALRLRSLEITIVNWFGTEKKVMLFKPESENLLPFNSWWPGGIRLEPLYF